MKRSELEEIIFEELEKAIVELDAATPTQLTEAPRKKRPGVGRKSGGRRGGEKRAQFTSRGTVPTERGRKMTDAQVTKRDEIGRKILNMWRRGGASGKKLRQSIKNHIEKKGWNPSDRKTVYSFIWAMATDYALTGRTFGGKKSKNKTKTGKITRPEPKHKGRLGTWHGKAVDKQGKKINKPKK